jgi:hypothetical protein
MMDEMQVEQEINRAYARYDSDPRVSGPDDMDAFHDAVRPLYEALETRVWVLERKVDVIESAYMAEPALQVDLTAALMGAIEVRVVGSAARKPEQEGVGG